MIVNVSKKILIVGLGLLGGSYARILKRFGFHISAITKEQSSVDYALREGIIDEGSTHLDKKIIGDADIVIFALYPHIFVEWIEQRTLALSVSSAHCCQGSPAQVQGHLQTTAVAASIPHPQPLYSAADSLFLSHSETFGVPHCDSRSSSPSWLFP